MIDKCKDCPLYKEKLEEVLKTHTLSSDILIEMYIFTQKCNCKDKINIK